MEQFKQDQETEKQVVISHKDLLKLLANFWQRTSDACPLECIEAEKQEKEWEIYIKDRFKIQ